MNGLLRRLFRAACIVMGVSSLAYGQPPGRPQVELPDGDAKAFIEGVCTACHETNLIVGSAGYSEAGWRSLFSTMIKLPDAQADNVAAYLAQHFPASDERHPVLAPGDARISFREWMVPTLGQRPRDPLQLEDGTIWWAGQYGSLVGRLNPRTGEMKEYRLDPEARPHSIIADADGNIWYMGNGNGTVGRLDPDTGDIKVYPMPDPEARDPHTPIFDESGNLWFTLQQSSMIGRMNPETEEIELIDTPTANARPYGIKMDSQGTIWIAYNGSNKIARIDPDTGDSLASMEYREYPTPTPESRIRRLALTSDDVIYYVDSARGYLGRLDPETGEIKTWPSPSGPLSHPYAIEIIDDIVWYNESGKRPDALVRFDPATEEFQSWAIPSGVGIIRHMRETPDGKLVIHQSSSNRIGLVTINDDT
jgi:virginiamycin B lyase